MTSVLRPRFFLLTDRVGTKLDFRVRTTEATGQIGTLGAPIFDETAFSEALLALATRRGSCPLDRDFGSRLHTITKAVQSVERLGASYILEAISHLLERGDIVDPVVSLTVRAPQLCWLLSGRDAAGKVLRIPYTHSVR